jgi:hypothetical protein
MTGPPTPYGPIANCPQTAVQASILRPWEIVPTGYTPSKPPPALIPLKIQIYLLLALLIFGIFSTHRSVRKSQSQEERFFAIRVSAFTWLLGIVLLVAFIFLPNLGQRLVFLLPVFVIVVTLAKFWKNGRARLRRQQQERTDLEQMKRVN